MYEVDLGQPAPHRPPASSAQSLRDLVVRTSAGLARVTHDANRIVLHALEQALYERGQVTTAQEAGIEPSAASAGDAYDNA